MKCRRHWCRLLVALRLRESKDAAAVFVWYSPAVSRCLLGIRFCTMTDCSAHIARKCCTQPAAASIGP